MPKTEILLFSRKFKISGLTDKAKYMGIILDMGMGIQTMSDTYFGQKAIQRKQDLLINLDRSSLRKLFVLLTGEACLQNIFSADFVMT